MKTPADVPNIHLFSANSRHMMLEVDHGRMYELDELMVEVLGPAIAIGDTHRVSLMLSAAGLKPQYVPEIPVPEAVPVRSFSLAIAQKCNLGCTYCYAEQGTFGGNPSNMSMEVAKASVDLLIADCPPGEQITLAFMGGEPLFNRAALHATTVYTVEQAQKKGVKVAFTITTNATLIRAEDVELFQKYNFTVTVSIDGIGQSNDALRPYISGQGSFEQVKKKLELLLAVPQRTFKVLGRVTVTPQNLDLVETFTGLLELGFDQVQFSPMLKSPTGKAQMEREDFETLLDQLIACGEIFREGFHNKKLLPLKNVLSGLQRIHKYQREMYPCGAGGGYMGVSAEGELYACHRFVNDEAGHMGNLESGVDPAKQGAWLKDRHLEAQGSACTTCWARYMCSGSCHHEVIKRGRPACDYIRGWLDYCLGLYVDLAESDPIGLRLILGDHQALSSEEDELEKVI